MMKKLLALALVAPLLVSCSSKKGEDYNEAWIKDTNGFDILMGQFAHNIENIWGFNEVLIAGPKDYVKYTDAYQTRSHINFDERYHHHRDHRRHRSGARTTASGDYQNPADG